MSITYRGPLVTALRHELLNLINKDAISNNTFQFDGIDGLVLTNKVNENRIVPTPIIQKPIVHKVPVIYDTEVYDQLVSLDDFRRLVEERQLTTTQVAKICKIKYHQAYHYVDKISDGANPQIISKYYHQILNYNKKFRQIKRTRYTSNKVKAAARRTMLTMHDNHWGPVVDNNCLQTIKYLFDQKNMNHSETLKFTNGKPKGEIQKYFKGDLNLRQKTFMKLWNLFSVEEIQQAKQALGLV